MKLPTCWEAASMLASLRAVFHPMKEDSYESDEMRYECDVSMYGRLRYVHVNVHGKHDELQQDGLHDARDGVHASGLRRDVQDDHGHDDARVVHVREDVHDVRGDVHGVLQHVLDGEFRRNDGALRRDVQALRRFVQQHGQDVHGRLTYGSR